MLISRMKECRKRCVRASTHPRTGRERNGREMERADHETRSNAWDPQGQMAWWGTPSDERVEVGGGFAAPRRERERTKGACG